MQFLVTGRVFSGMGKGRYYVGHPEYQKRFSQRLGYTPYPGTLNIKLEDSELMRRLRELKSTDGIEIEGFAIGGESFSALRCFDGEMNGIKITLLFIDVTYYNETVSEVISPEYLRGKLALHDGDLISFNLDVPSRPPNAR